MLFNNQKEQSVNVPIISDGTKPNINWLVEHLCENVMEDSRKELFVLDGSV